MPTVQIHRLECPEPGVEFKGPHESAPITFAWQAARQKFSIWYRSDQMPSDDQHQGRYMVVPTGSPFPNSYQLVASAVMEDGFHTFHLVMVM